MLKAKIALALAALALAVPAIALGNPGGTPNEGQGHEGTPPSKAKAYGKYCQGESKKHVAGEKGTAFSRCVNTMAHAANHENQSPREACKGKSKKHVKGEKGTEFSRCVTAVAKLRHDEHQKEQEEKAQEEAAV